MSNFGLKILVIFYELDSNVVYLQDYTSIKNVISVAFEID